MRSQILFAIVAAVLMASSVSAVTTFRHQFQYAMKPEHMNKRAESEKRWTWFCQNAPKDAKPSLCQFGSDLGIAAKLYTWSGSANPNVDFAGRVDFPSENALRQFWKFVYPNATYTEMVGTWVKDAFRIQYITNTCSYPAPGTYWRHSFEYQIRPSAQCGSGASTAAVPAGTANVNNFDIQKSVRAWYKFCQDAPARPVTCVFGPDLGVSKEFYPSPNMAFGGSLDFKTESDMVAFWKYVFGTPLYKEITGNNLLASRIQYQAVFK